MCSTQDLAAEGMAAFSVDGIEVLVLRDTTGTVRAMDGTCPHEDFPLVYGDFDGTVLTCANHLWSFDATTGRGINPPNCRLEMYALRVEGDEVLVDTDESPGAVDP